MKTKTIPCNGALLKSKVNTFCLQESIRKEGIADRAGCGIATMNRMFKDNKGNAAYIRSICSVVGADYDSIIQPFDDGKNNALNNETLLSTIVNLLEKQNELLEKILTSWE